MTALDRLAEHYGPGSADLAHPLFVALWEECPNPPPGTRSRYVRRSRAEAESRLLEAVRQMGYAVFIFSLRDGREAWQGQVVKGKVDCSAFADDPYEALTAAILAVKEKP